MFANLLVCLEIAFDEEKDRAPECLLLLLIREEPENISHEEDSQYIFQASATDDF
jgi:hypothetical protein